MRSPPLDTLYAAPLGSGTSSWMLDTLTMAPPPRAAIIRAAARAHRKGPVRFTASTRSHSSSGMSTTAEPDAMPALLTSTSRPPSSRSTRAIMAATSALDDTSVRTASAPGRRSASARASSSCPKWLTTTWAPAPASRSAVACPMPLPAPVTSAIRPLRSMGASVHYGDMQRVSGRAERG